MPQPTLLGLRIYQMGKETTRGTAVAATSKMAVEMLDLDELDTIHRPAIAKGLLHRYPGSETVVHRSTSWSIPATPLLYDQIQNFLSMWAKGGVTPSGVGPYLWSYPMSLTTDPAPDAWTIERRITDGSTNIDFQWAYCLIEEFSVDYAIDKPLMFSAKGFARRVKTNALTAALALPNIELPPTPLAQVWIDSTWGTIGTTIVAGQVVKAKYTFKTGLKPAWTFDGRADLDYTSYILDAKSRGIDVDISAFVLGSGQFSTEKTAAEAGTLRAIRTKVAGTGSRYFQIDALLKHVKGSVFKVGVDNGQDLVDFKLVDSDDGANLSSIVVSNQVATYI